MSISRKPYRTLGLISFPKILADLSSVPKITFFINPKTQDLKFPISRTFEVKLPLANCRGLRAFRNDLLGAPDCVCNLQRLELIAYH